MLTFTDFSTISGSLGTSGMSISGRGGSSRTEDKLWGGGDAGGVTATCEVTLGDGRRGGLWEIIILHILKLLVINSRMREYVYLWRILLPDISYAQPEKLILYKTSIHNFQTVFDDINVFTPLHTAYYASTFNKYTLLLHHPYRNTLLLYILYLSSSVFLFSFRSLPCYFSPFLSPLLLLSRSLYLFALRQLFVIK